MQHFISSVKILHSVLEQKKILSDALEQDLNESREAKNIVLTTLRHWGQIKNCIQCFIRPGSSKIPTEVFIILGVGLTQLHWLQHPSYAVVNKAVEYSKRKNLQRFSGMINAILRKLSDPTICLEKIASSSPVLNLGPFLYESWARHYGQQMVDDMAKIMLEKPYLDLQFKDHDPQKHHDWIRQDGIQQLPLGTFRIPHAHPVLHTGKIKDLPAFDNGNWWVQDFASSLPIKLLGNLNDQQALDLCASPGGKSFLLAKAGARVTAIEKSKLRYQRMLENLKRLKFPNVQPIYDDVMTWKNKTLFDVVILDAPCSATGTLRHHPDLAWVKNGESVHHNLSIQSSMLGRAQHWVKPGGLLVYSVCSLEPEEGALQIEHFLSQHQNFSRSPWPLQSDPVFQSVAHHLTPVGDLLTLPHASTGKAAHPEDDLKGMDGFYAACLVKSTE